MSVIPLKRYAPLAMFAVLMCSHSLAQSTSSAAYAGETPACCEAAKPPIRQKTPAKAPAKYFITVYSLAEKQFGPSSCLSQVIHFPATNAAAVGTLLGEEPGFTLTAIPPNKIAIYYKKPIVPKPALAKLEADIDGLAQVDFRRAVALPVPFGTAKKLISTLAVPSDAKISVQAVSSECILIVGRDQFDQSVFSMLTTSIPSLYWQNPVAPPTQRLFYVDATTVAKELSTPGPGKENGEGAGPTPTKPTENTQANKGSTDNGGSAPAISISVASNGQPDAQATKSTNGTETSPSGKSQSTQSSNDDAGTTSRGASQVASNTNHTTSSSVAKSVAMQPVNDLLVISNPDGTDAGILERNRLMAVIDLPRPEILMSIWSLQASSKDYRIVTAEAQAASQLITHHNDILQLAIDRGWDSLSRQMREPGFFNELFYRYVTQKFGVTLSEVDRAQLGSDNAEEHSTKEPQEKAIETNRPQWGWCGSDKYCLGFSHAFEPLRPTFTNLLIGLIAAKKPSTVSEITIDAMEGHTNGPQAPTGCDSQSGPLNDSCASADRVGLFRACIRKADLDLHTFKSQSIDDCQLQDRIAMSEEILAGREENLHLSCFREQASKSFSPASGQTAQYITTRAGLLRAAIADFLFNYKWAAQYPHDFIPYDLTQSAQELNTEFNPLVLAFNRDVSAFSENLQSELQCDYDANISHHTAKAWFQSGDATFINDGMLSVRGISGVESLVDTVSQSMFDATSPPSLTDLVKAVSDAEKNVPGVMKANLTANEAAVLLGALNSVTPAEAKIGRELKLDIIPHSLAGASSAELEVKLTAEEAGSPTRFTSDKSAEDTLSRVAKHDVSTRVRVESLKLFDVSAFSAMLERPRSKFPIIPPFFEVPYFGSFVGWPLSGAKVYHRSTAVVSAVIVPTAADLAFGIDFGADRLCTGGVCYRANSPSDFGRLPLRSFHKVMIECLASDGSTAYAGLQTPSHDLLQAKTACNDVSLFKSAHPASPQRNVVPPQN